MTKLADIERRALEVRADGSRLTGYAAVFNSPSHDLGGFVETIKPGAFANSLRRGDDVLALYHHDTRAVLGRSKAGTLRLTEDAKGLRFDLDVANTTVGRDVLESVGRGDITGASFGFRAIRDAWTKGVPHMRELIEVELLDVTITPSPAYPATVVSRRSLDAITEAERRARYLDHLRGYHGIA
ncbi:MAG: HK97 family phage prohead protease [Proteobacteria bacterium]|nr:HK97 family phage prohead protease [Pseudomonadota bacterium]